MDDINAGYERLSELQVTVIFGVVTMIVLYIPSILCDAYYLCLDKHSRKQTVRSLLVRTEPP